MDWTGRQQTRGELVIHYRGNFRFHSVKEAYLKDVNIVQAYICCTSHLTTIFFTTDSTARPLTWQSHHEEVYKQKWLDIPVCTDLRTLHVSYELIMCSLMPRMYEDFEAERFNQLEVIVYCGISLDPQTSDQKSVSINSNAAKIRTRKISSQEYVGRTAFWYSK
jgi:hypothetical protein